MKYDVIYNVNENNISTPLHLQIIAPTKTEARELALFELQKVFKKDDIKILDVIHIEIDSRKIKF